MNPEMLRAELAEAKRKLPLRALMAELGHAESAKDSARCPFHDDANPSFSTFRGQDGSWHWKCHAQCGSGDEIAYLAKARNLSIADAIREFKRMAGVLNATPDRNGCEKFDWDSCVKEFTPGRLEALAQWRKFSPDFVAWLHAKSLVGVYRGQIAFPVTNNVGQIIGCHYRTEQAWAYGPKGTSTGPLIIGDVRSASVIHAFESQWDAGAVINCMGWHKAMPEGTAFVATRGASNGKLIGQHPPTTTVFAWLQNDEAGQRWFTAVAEACECPCLRVVTPAPHKDGNDWTRAGATSDDLAKALSEAKPYAPGVVRSISTSSDHQPTHDDSQDEQLEQPFPVAALGPVMAPYVKAVARAERVPETLVAVCALGTVSAALGAGLQVESGPKRKTRGNIYILASADSGSGKSETFRIVTKPFFDFQKEQIDLHEKRNTEIQGAIRVIEKEIASLERKAPKCTDQQLRQGIIDQINSKLEERKNFIGKAVIPCLVAQDVTTERLASLLGENREVSFSASADARKLVDNVMGRYSPGKTTDESLYLKAYSGDYVRVDRQKPPPVVLHQPCLSLTWLVQPDIVSTLLDEDSLSSSGFIARLLLCHTRALPRKIEEAVNPIPAGTLANWDNSIAVLLSTYHQAATPFTIKPTPEAKAALDSYNNAIIDRRSVELADVGVFAARWAEQAWRLSVIIHASFHGPEAHNHELSLESAHCAIEIAEWFSSQQLSILAKTRNEAATKLEDEVLDLLKSNHDRKGVDHVTARDVYRARIAATPEAAQSLLSRMQAEGILACDEIRPPQGGKTMRLYRSATNRGFLRE